MDDTQGSRMSDAVATRKRRSSILKNQRPPRTPFSELEFNVATPTDTAKSRRVSFSRRTDVAEFVTNEATTTWKTMYVEQNRSLESSGNESALHPPRQTVCHLGKRIFDQQFQEVEMDYASLASNPLVRDMNVSLMNVNFTQQIADLENPKHKMEMSSLTEDKSRLFTDLTAPSIGLTDGIKIDFSVVQPVGKCDDLDEIQRDLREQASLRRPFPDTPGTDYIEVDLNTTHVGIGHEIASDMSITDTIRSPEVKSQQDKSSKCDWAVDKENIAINPYAVPKESINFAVNEIPDQVLVFDGRRLTVQTERKTMDGVEYQSVPNIEPSNQRKTIVLNVNDDLPNFVDDASLLGQMHGLSTSKVEKRNASNAPNSVLDSTDLDPVVQKTVYDNDISVTQAIPTNILQKEKRQTIVFESDACELSMTQAVPTEHLLSNQNNNQTRVYSDDISFTQAVPAKVLVSEVKKAPNTSVTKVDNDFEISFTQAIPNNMVLSQKPIHNKSNTTVYGKDVDISITRVLPSNIIVSDTRKAGVSKADCIPNEKSIVYDRGCDISMTQTVPKNIILSTASESNFNNIAPNENDISVTRMLPSNIIESSNNLEKSTRDPFMNMSMTEAIPGNVLLSRLVEQNKTEQSDSCDISMTKVLPTNIITTEHTINNTMNNVQVNQSAQESIVVLNVFLNKSVKETKTEETQTSESITRNLCKSQVNTSMTQAVQTEDFSYTLQSNCTRDVVSDDNNVSQIKEKQLNLANESQVKQNFKDSNEKSVLDFKENTIDSSGAITSKSLSEGKLNCPQNDNSQTATSFKDNTSELTKQDTVITVNLNNETRETENISLFDKKSLQTPDKKNLNSSKCCSHYVSQTFIINKSVADMKHQDVFVYQAVTEHNMSNIETADDNMDIDCDTEKSLLSDSPKKIANLTHERKEESNRRNVEDKLSTSQKPRKSILTELLKMSNDSIDISTNSGDNKDVLERVPKTDCFEISKDDDNIKECHSDKSLLIQKSNIEVYEEENPHKTNISSTERYYENDLSVNFECRQINEISKQSSETSSLESLNDQCDSKEAEKNGDINNQYKEADDTKELLEMLSDFTDRTINKQSRTDAKTEEPVVEENSNNSVPRPLSIAKSRMSIVLSREDLLNNISMAHAALQQARSDTDESDEDLEDEEDTPIDEMDVVDQIDAADEIIEELKQATEDSSSRRSVRASTEVVKTLQFDDSVNDQKSEDRLSPLRKTLIREVSRTSDKGKVIPPYTDASDEVKSLMDDLVKPMADDVQYDRTVDKSTKELNTTRNINIQANITTSSQIDIIESEYDMVSTDAQTDSEDIKNCPPLVISKSFEFAESDKTSANQSKITDPAPVLIFDHTNPLNNVLLSPTGKNEAHKYSPVGSPHVKTKNSSPIKPVLEKTTDEEFNVHRVSTHYNINTSLKCELVQEKRSSFSNNSYLDKEIKDSEVNTSIAMKNNKELLEETSCLTLVDDDEEPILIEDTQPLQYDTKPEQISPLRVIFKLDGEDNSASSDIDTDDSSKPKKRVYSPAKREGRAASSIELTPKPLSKVQKLSNSPRIKVTPESANNKTLIKSINKQTRRDAKPTFGNTVIVQQLECLKVQGEGDGNDKMSESSSGSTLKTEKLEDFASNIPWSITSSSDTKEVQFSTSSSISKFSSSKSTQYIDSIQSFHTASFTQSSKESNQSYKEIKSSPNPREVASVQTCKETSYIQSNKEVHIKELNSNRKSIKFDSDENCKADSIQSCKETNINSKSKQAAFNHSIKEFESNQTLNKIISSDDCKVASITSCKETKTNHSNQEAIDQITKITLNSSIKEMGSIQSSNKIDLTQSDISPERCINEYRSSNILANSESSVNILDKIDALPFMGHDCEWDWSDAETLRFRLMRGRLRLVVRLQHVRVTSRVHVHSRRAHVPPDTAVLDASVELAQEDADPLARMCARLASEAMRYECVRVCGGASLTNLASTSGLASSTDLASSTVSASSTNLAITPGLASAKMIPSLLRRSAAVARLARRWARVMRDARAHLAYTVAGDGGLAFKVANIPLRTVFEVTLQINLVVEDAREVAWARAGRVRVRDVTAGCPARHVADDIRHADDVTRHAGHAGDAEGVHARDLQRLLARVPHDWGHVPRTLWKVFRHLKNKTKDDELLGI